MSLWIGGVITGAITVFAVFCIVVCAFNLGESAAARHCRTYGMFEHDNKLYICSEIKDANE